MPSIFKIFQERYSRRADLLGTGRMCPLFDHPGSGPGESRGLGVDFNDLMAVASGGEPGKTWTAESLRDAINKMVDDENVGEAVKVLIGKPPGEVKKALKYLRRKSD